MESTAPYASAALGSATPSYWSNLYLHDLWMQAQGIPSTAATTSRTCGPSRWPGGRRGSATRPSSSFGPARRERGARDRDPAGRDAAARAPGHRRGRLRARRAAARRPSGRRTARRRRSSGRSTACSCCRTTATTSSRTCRATGRSGCCTTTTCRSRCRRAGPDALRRAAARARRAWTARATSSTPRRRSWPEHDGRDTIRAGR